MTNSERSPSGLIVPEKRIRVPFPQEVKREMSRNGWRFISFPKEQLISLPSEEQVAYWREWIKMYPEADVLADRFSEVAIAPKFFLTDTMNKLRHDQKKILDDRNKENKKRGYIEIEGDATDYAMIASAFYTETGGDLFGDRYTTTDTMYEDGRIYVGGKNGPFVRKLNPNHISWDVGLASIAIPHNPPAPDPNSR